MIKHNAGDQKDLGLTVSPPSVHRSRIRPTPSRDQKEADYQKGRNEGTGREGYSKCKCRSKCKYVTRHEWFNQP